eukprot:GEMP01010014.1.p1 GENE.GEMP01010014.1~~GEMP01010014.1.p1  ORF type:complete len:291 (+),score=40.47 GEMP01010014.1:113-985(+)
MGNSVITACDGQNVSLGGFFNESPTSQQFLVERDEEEVELSPTSQRNIHIDRTSMINRPRVSRGMVEYDDFSNRQRTSHLFGKMDTPSRRCTLEARSPRLQAPNSNSNVHVLNTVQHDRDTDVGRAGRDHNIHELIEAAVLRDHAQRASGQAQSTVDVSPRVGGPRLRNQYMEERRRASNRSDVVGVMERLSSSPQQSPEPTRSVDVSVIDWETKLLSRGNESQMVSATTYVDEYNSLGVDAQEAPTMYIEEDNDLDADALQALSETMYEEGLEQATQKPIYLSAKSFGS